MDYNVRSLEKEAGKMVAVNMFAGIKKWEKVAPEDKTKVEEEARALAKALVVEGYSRIAVGQHLAEAQAILQPHGLFKYFCGKFNFSLRTAYRYITRYENAQNVLPETIVKVAMAKGMEIAGVTKERPLGVYEEAARKLGIPKTANMTEAGAWLEKVKEIGITQPGPRLVQKGPEELLRTTFGVVRLRIQQVDGARRETWFRELVGMCLTELGLGEQVYAPMPIPEDFISVRGRPAAA